jgi:hypothetical protein
MNHLPQLFFRGLGGWVKPPLYTILKRGSS